MRACQAALETCQAQSQNNNCSKSLYWAGGYRLGISDGWSGVLGRLFQTRSVMGRLWDDHFRDLGHPPKFYRVQDASSGNNSPFWYHFRVILMENHWKIINLHVFLKKWLSTKKKKAPARMLVTVVRSGDAPKPPFPIKTGKKLENPKNQPQINHRNYPLFPTLH